ncbi:uncharacterized protein peak3 [Esox lucius]|uniref:uncharacterized protein peak3 n=1 Tax=Esox lucius TaxID=8010 RepID=UPI0014776303|nr:uncharacterized protein peak3 [Esox lucius]
MDQPHGPDREREPPALPIKQRRSHYSGGSSVSSNVDLELDRSVSSLLGYHAHEGHNSTDVFLTATDCHAPQCPIHQRYDPSYCHQERFFSDSVTPPPVPKKRLIRTMSLPGVPLCPLSTPPVQPLSQLNFDTPDEQLSYFFSSFFNQGDLSRGIQHRHLLFLRSMAQRLEARVLLKRESKEGAGPFQPKDFLLFENNPPIQIAGSLYYSLHTPKFPDRILAAKGQLRALLEYCLHMSDSASGQNTQSSDNASQRSPYQPGLRKLASWLQDESSKLKIAEILGVLQAVLWGPREALFRVNPNRLFTLQNWLSVKQALMLLKLAERGLIQDLLGFDWEHYLCLQYISFTDSETVMKSTARLGLHNTED